jgi:farnesyl-diphosphate farnesyltransferase
MSDTLNLHKEAMDMLLATSRTFFIPINRLTGELQQAVASAYLCMRAIDEIEDHQDLPKEEKIKLLQAMSQILKDSFDENLLRNLFQPYYEVLPEVTIRIADWINLSPFTIRPSILQATAEMAEGMAYWVSKAFQIKNEEELDHYTYVVAGAVGVLLSEIWLWHEDLPTDREQSIAFGRGLQAVNIIRNHEEDLERGVSFFPAGWGAAEMFAYAKRNLAQADAYISGIHSGPIHDFCIIPLALAHGTLEALEAGESKLSRAEVIQIVNQVTE